MSADPDTKTEASVVTPSRSRQHLRGLPLLVLQTQRVLERTPVAVVAVVVGLVTLLIHGYRLSVAPDVFSDEGIYLLVGTSLARGVGLTLNQSAFLWHPPAYMLIEAAYIKLAGLTNADPLSALLSVRYLNIFFSACTAALLMLFGRKLHSYKAGLAAAALFLMDPYVQRVNRRSMLETLAMLCVLLGLYIFFTRRPHLTTWQRIGSGVAFGLAMLTKEAMLLELFVLIAYVTWFRRSQLRDVAWVAAIACALYLLYPAWEVAIGQGNSYLSFKLFAINRILSSLTGHPPPSFPPGANFTPPAAKTFSLDNLQILLSQYGMSYLLIALAAIFTVVLILRFRHLVAANFLITWFRHLVAARFIITWSIFSFGFGLVLGKISDQYFYYLIVPCTIAAGYVLATLLETFLHSRSPGEMSTFDLGRPVFSRNSMAYRMMWWPIFALFLVMLLYNGFEWVERYAVGSDDAYIKVIEYVRTHIPSGETIVTSDDVAYYFLSPSYNIRLDRNTKIIMDRHEHYFIMSSKDAWGGYNATTPQFYNWIVGNSHPVFVQDDQSFWKIGVYEQTATSTPIHITSPPPSVTIVKSYFGTLYNIPLDLTTKMSLTSIQQSQTIIRGYFTAFQVNGMQVKEPFSGMIDAQGHIHFTVAEYDGQITLSFEGGVQADGTLAGSYCNLEQYRHCAGEYGIWSISPAEHHVGAHLLGSSHPTKSAMQQPFIPTDSIYRKGTTTT